MNNFEITVDSYGTESFAESLSSHSKLRPRGIITISNMFSHSIESSRGNDDEHYEDDDEEQSVLSEILQLVRPLALYVDEMLNAAVAECDPDKETKKGKSDSNSDSNSDGDGDTETQAAAVLAEKGKEMKVAGVTKRRKKSSA